MCIFFHIIVGFEECNLMLFNCVYVSVNAPERTSLLCLGKSNITVTIVSFMSYYYSMFCPNVSDFASQIRALELQCIHYGSHQIARPKHRPVL